MNGRLLTVLIRTVGPAQAEAIAVHVMPIRCGHNLRPGVHSFPRRPGHTHARAHAHATTELN